MRGLLVSFLLGSTFAAAPALATFQADRAAPAPLLSPDAKTYVDEAIAMFKKSHINSAKADWPALTAKAYATVAGAKSKSDTYPAIQLIIKELGEKHTSFWDPDTAKANETGTAAGAAPAPVYALMEGDKLANGVGVVRLYGFSGSDVLGRHYADYGRSRIAGLRAQGVCRFIVDLRNNTGGNLYPMLSALSPLLNDGVLGTWDYADGRKTFWGIMGGVGVETSDKMLSSIKRKAGALPVAVIIGPRTASSGEFAAIAFKGRPNTRFFGMATAGYVTSNDPFKLSDGAIIVMTDSWGSDRTGKRYSDPIMPDEATGFGGPTIDAANKWLLSRTCPIRGGQQTLTSAFRK